MNDKGVFKNKIYKLLKIHTGPVKYVSDKYRYQSNIDGRGGWIFNLENSIYSVLSVVQNCFDTQYTGDLYWSPQYANSYMYFNQLQKSIDVRQRQFYNENNG